MPLLLEHFQLFFSGLLDDITHSVECICEAYSDNVWCIISFWGSGLLVTNVELPFMDYLFQYSIIFVFSLILHRWLCHSMNLIDGLNGL